MNQDPSMSCHHQAMQCMSHRVCVDAMLVSAHVCADMCVRVDGVLQAPIARVMCQYSYISRPQPCATICACAQRWPNTAHSAGAARAMYSSWLLDKAVLEGLHCS